MKSEDRFCIKCGKITGLLQDEDICYNCGKERGIVAFECEHSFIDEDNQAPYGYQLCRICGLRIKGDTTQEEENLI